MEHATTKEHSAPAHSSKQARYLLIIAGLVILGSGITLLTNEDIRESLIPSKAIASVNGKTITEREFEKNFIRAKPIFEREGADLSDPDTLSRYRGIFLNEMIDNALLYQAGVAHSIQVPDSAIQEEIERMEGRAGSPALFDQELARKQITRREMRENLEEQLLIQRYLMEHTKIGSLEVSEEEALALYARVKSEAPETAPSFEQVRSEIESRLMQQKVTALVAEHLEELRAQGEVVIH